LLLSSLNAEKPVYNWVTNGVQGLRGFPVYSK